MRGLSPPLLMFSFLSLNKSSLWHFTISIERIDLPWDEFMSKRKYFFLLTICTYVLSESFCNYPGFYWFNIKCVVLNRAERVAYTYTSSHPNYVDILRRLETEPADLCQYMRIFCCSLLFLEWLLWWRCCWERCPFIHRCSYKRISFLERQKLQRDFN